MAQREAAIPIKATMLFPSVRCFKSNKVILKTNRPKATKIRIEVKIFIRSKFDVKVLIPTYMHKLCKMPLVAGCFFINY
ncbi:MAG: hypothetical protein RL699_360 [Bacteroidota bacterium]